MRAGKVDFMFAAAGLEHGHIYGMCDGLVNAGASLKWAYDPDEAKLQALIKRFPGARQASCLDEILDDRSVSLVASAAIPSERAALGIRVMEAGKDYFTDKAPLTTLGQLELVRGAIARTGRKFAVYYSERVNSECAVLAGRFIEAGVIGRVAQVMGWGPHRLSPNTRPSWFYEREKTGGIIIDLLSHQIEQFLFFANEEDATIDMARVDNFFHKDKPGIDDFGDIALTGKAGARGYARVDWLTPDGLTTWGDGRVIILGEKGYIELRKNLNVATGDGGNQMFVVDGQRERRIDASGKTGFPFFQSLIRDCQERTELAMSQEHALKAAEIAVRAQMMALGGKISGDTLD